MSYIEFKKINKFFGDSHVLKDICLNVEKGQFATLLGPSGCGKSTLLRCLAGLEQVSAGEIFLDGADITNMEPKDRGIGMVFQQYSLFPNMTVEENIAFGLRIRKARPAELQSRVAEAVAMVDLQGKEGAYPASLSGGQQQRVALARSIVNQPKVLLLDEPLSAIDAKLRHSLQKEICRIQRDLEITTIFVTHDQDEAMIMSDVIHLFRQGEIEQSGRPVEMYTAPKTSFAASFIGHYNILAPQDFDRLVGRLTGRKGNVAIRPETIEISPEPFDNKNEEEFYYFQGRIQSSLARGNVLRYKVASTAGSRLEADALFRSFRLFHDDQPVYLSVEKRNCLELES